MTNTQTSPPVRTRDDVAALAAAAGLYASPINTPNRWVGINVAVQCWPNFPFQVAVYGYADGDGPWSGIFDYDTPASVIAAVIAAAKAGA